MRVPKAYFVSLKAIRSDVKCESVKGPLVARSAKNGLNAMRKGLSFKKAQ